MSLLSKYHFLVINFFIGYQVKIQLYNNFLLKTINDSFEKTDNLIEKNSNDDQKKFFEVTIDELFGNKIVLSIEFEFSDTFSDIINGSVIQFLLKTLIFFIPNTNQFFDSRDINSSVVKTRRKFRTIFI